MHIQKTELVKKNIIFLAKSYFVRVGIGNLQSDLEVATHSMRVIEHEDEFGTMSYQVVDEKTIVTNRGKLPNGGCDDSRM